MEMAAALLLLSSVYPLVLALRANQSTTLRQPLRWACLAWLAWVGVAWSRVLGQQGVQPVATYGALCLTGCAGVAVLGARRPGVTAWNFVVVGLLAVLLLPILNGQGSLRLEAVEVLFLSATLAISFLNYFPTRLVFGALFAAAGCGWELARLLTWTSTPDWVGSLLLALAPWAAWAGVMKSGKEATAFDRLWLAYRDRFGFVWGQRMREQFNRAAHHAGWPVVLLWRGLQPSVEHLPLDSEQLLATLLAVLKRFGPEDQGQPFDPK